MTSQCFCMNSTPGREAVHGDAVDAMAHFGVRIGKMVRGLQARD